MDTEVEILNNKKNERDYSQKQVTQKGDKTSYSLIDLNCKGHK